MGEWRQLKAAQVQEIAHVEVKTTLTRGQNKSNIPPERTDPGTASSIEAEPDLLPARKVDSNIILQVNRHCS